MGLARGVAVVGAGMTRFHHKLHLDKTSRDLFVEAALEALTAALAMPGDVRRAVSKRARERVLSEFTPEKETGRIMEILRRLCPGGVSAAEEG